MTTLDIRILGTSPHGGTRDVEHDNPKGQDIIAGGAGGIGAAASRHLARFSARVLMADSLRAEGLAAHCSASMATSCS